MRAGPWLWLLVCLVLQVTRAAGQTAIDPLSVAEAALAHGQYDEAANLAEKLLETQPRATLIAASAHLNRGRITQAIALLTRATTEPRRFRALSLLGTSHALRGETTLAKRAFDALIAAFNADQVHADDGEALAAVAVAARGLLAYRDANRAFAEAARASPNDVEIELAWAELFLDKYDTENAERSLARVLKLNPQEARALERMARIRIEQGAGFSIIEGLLNQALAVNPKLVAAHVSRAGLLLRDMELEAADKQLDLALEINPRDLEALSVRVAVRFLADDEKGMARAEKAVLTENPRFSRMYSIVATYAEWEHRYEELVKFADAALRINPDDAYAYATRGLNLLRTGNEREGLAALAQAWSRDRYNVHVFNTLNLYEDVISKEYESTEAPPFRLRTQRDEKEVLETYALPLLKRAYADMQKRYDFTPKGPLSIELYANPQHFSIRTSGLPHLGVQGVCFGKVLTAVSPRGGEFNWGQILWHELSHVFHVQSSKSHVPRWFTEGLAEYETIVARPEWKREDDRALWDALEAGNLPALSDFNRAFTHAQSPEQLMVAYYGSSQIVAYIVKRFDFRVVPKLLSAWGEGKRTDVVLSKVLGVDSATLDRDFRASLRTRLSARYAHDFRIDIGRYENLEERKVRAQVPHAPLVDRAAFVLSLARAGHKDAVSAAEAILREVPGEPHARFALAHLALIAGDIPHAVEHLQKLVASGHDGYQIRLLLARCFEKQKATPQAIQQLEAAIAIDSERPEAHELLAKLAEATFDEARLVAALDHIVQGDQHARAPLARLLPLLEKRGDLDTLAKRAESGLYVDPENPLVHRLLAEAWSQRGRAKEAMVEADVALKLSTSAPEQARAELTRARVLLVLGQREPARAAAQHAVALDESVQKQAESLISR